MIVKKMKKCLVCGKEYADGSYHTIHCGVVYRNDRKSYDWNCNKVEKLKLHEIEEKIIASFINNKPSSLLIYE
jgi:hypothetical protein